MVCGEGGWEWCVMKEDGRLVAIIACARTKPLLAQCASCPSARCQSGLRSPLSTTFAPTLGVWSGV